MIESIKLILMEHVVNAIRIAELLYFSFIVMYIYSFVLSAINNISFVQKTNHIYAKIGNYIVAPSVILHELSHIIFVLLYKFEIVDYNLINFNKNVEYAGFVRYKSKNGAWSNCGIFFVSMAPFIMQIIISCLFVYSVVGNDFYNDMVQFGEMIYYGTWLHSR